MSSVVHGTNGQVTTAPTDVVQNFLRLLAAGDIDAAMELVDPDIAYINVSLPALHGRDRVRRAMEFAFGPKQAGFEVYFHSVSADGGHVLTERTDVLCFGPVRVQIWVVGRFDVEGGRITMWKDYFDWLNAAVSLVRGLLGAVVPALRPKPPA